MRPQKDKVRTFLDFEPIEHISVAGALVLAAEIDRWRRIKRTNLRLRNTDRWNSGVKRILCDLGFFGLLDVNISFEVPEEGRNNHITVIPFISSSSVQGELFGEIRNYMHKIAEVFSQDPSIYGALTEAAYNSVLHAYPKGRKFEYPIAGKRWWATCSYNPKDDAVRFLVYDPGVGIPETLPRWKHWEKVREKIQAVPLVGPAISQALNDHSRTIEAAIDVSRTSMSGGHGKGLKDVVTPVDLIRGAKVRLLSANGSVLYSDGRCIERRDEMLHIGGTLIEWTIPAGRTQEEVES